jgi:hypothetical protein
MDFRSRIIVIDVDRGDDPAAAEPRIPALPHGCVRIILKERTGLRRKDISQFSTDVKDVLFKSLPDIKAAAKTRVFSNIARPALEAISEIPIPKTMLQYRLHSKFSLRSLQEVLRFESKGVGFVLQTDFQESSYYQGTSPTIPVGFEDAAK